MYALKDLVKISKTMKIQDFFTNTTIKEVDAGKLLYFIFLKFYLKLLKLLEKKQFLSVLLIYQLREP